MNCRFCNASLSHVFADLGQTPLANSYPTKSEITSGEHYFPLLAYVCSKCFLVQLEQFEDPSKIFRHYAYKNKPRKLRTKSIFLVIYQYNKLILPRTFYPSIIFVYK